MKQVTALKKQKESKMEIEKKKQSLKNKKSEDKKGKI